MTSSTVAAPATGGFLVRSGDQETLVRADAAVLAIGYTPEHSLYDRVRNKVPEAYLLGDARQVQNIMYAIWDAYEVARGL